MNLVDLFFYRFQRNWYSGRDMYYYHFSNGDQQAKQAIPLIPNINSTDKWALAFVLSVEMYACELTVQKQQKEIISAEYSSDQCFVWFYILYLGLELTFTTHRHETDVSEMKVIAFCFQALISIAHSKEAKKTYMNKSRRLHIFHFSTHILGQCYSIRVNENAFGMQQPNWGSTIHQSLKFI